MTTKVTHVRLLQKGWWDNPDYVYIGGKTDKYGEQGYEAYWRNPIYVPTDANTEERERICREYESMLLEWITDPIFRRSVRQLSGKILVGFDHPKRGHGDSLAVLADKLQKEAEEWFKSITSPKISSLGELEYRDRLRREQIIHSQMQVVRTGWEECKAVINTEDTRRTGMPGWFKEVER